MPRGPRPPLWLGLLLLLPLAAAPGHGGAERPWEGTDEPGSARAWLRAAGALSRRYWTLFSCQLWPDDCDEADAAAGPGGKRRPRGRPPGPPAAPGAGCPFSRHPAGTPAAGAGFASLWLAAGGRGRPPPQLVPAPPDTPPPRPARSPARPASPACCPFPPSGDFKEGPPRTQLVTALQPRNPSSPAASGDAARGDAA